MSDSTFVNDSPLQAGHTVFVAGHRGMVGSAICRQLRALGVDNIITATRDELDLRNQADVLAFFQERDIDHVVDAAARVGGIYANDHFPADFIYDNLIIQCNLINAAHQADINRLLFLGSSCIYPKFAEQPMTESALLTGLLEPTNEPYAVAKIAGIKLCESFNRQHGRQYRSVMPTNLYGEGDNFHPKNSHVVPALIRRFHEGKLNNSPTVSVWGTGKAMRELLYVDDMAAACIHVMSLPDAKYEAMTETMVSHINIGTGEDMSIAELAETIQAVVGYEGKIHYDTEFPDGAPRKLLNVDRIHSLGWKHAIGLREGLETTYQWFLKYENELRER